MRCSLFKESERTGADYLSLEWWEIPVGFGISDSNIIIVLSCILDVLLGAHFLLKYTYTSLVVSVWQRFYNDSVEIAAEIRLSKQMPIISNKNIVKDTQLDKL